MIVSAQYITAQAAKRLRASLNQGPVWGWRVNCSHWRSGLPPNLWSVIIRCSCGLRPDSPAPMEFRVSNKRLRDAMVFRFSRGDSDASQDHKAYRQAGL